MKNIHTTIKTVEGRKWSYQPMFDNTMLTVMC